MALSPQLEIRCRMRWGNAFVPVKLRGIPLRKTHSCEGTKLPEGDFNTCIIMVASLDGVDLKP